MASKNTKNFTKRNSHGRSRTNDRFNTTKGKDDKVMDKKVGGNDPRWWGSPDFVNAVANFNFSSPLGKPVPYSYLNDENGTFKIKNAANAFVGTIPGIMAIDVLPTMGIGSASNDPVNQYIRSVYTKLRSTNNQSAPYQAPDLGMYIMAIDSIHMGIEQLIRMYGMARTYSAMNRYYPEAALRAMGLLPQSTDVSSLNFYSNLADFRADILNLLIKIQTLAIPKGISICERHRELMKYVYKDGESVKSQMYLFRTPYLYKYVEGTPSTASTGGKLQAMETPIDLTWIAWVRFVDDLINAVTDSSFFAIVSGDIIKAFGYENLYSMPFFDETYTVAPVYNPEILLEIHNLTVCGDRYDDTAFDITQDPATNTLICHPYTTTSNAPGACSVYPIIDVPIDNPSPDMVMVATRLTVSGYTGYTSDNKFKFNPTMVGTEMVTKLSIYVFVNGTVTNAYTYTNVVDGMSQVNGFLMYELFFDWHPHIHYMSVNTARTEAQYHTVMSELQNYTVMSPGDLEKMHEMAVYGALTMHGVDNVGTIKK